MPKSAEAALAAIAPPPAGRFHYREEVRHPALRTPMVARGTLSALPGQGFRKDQTWPRAETSEIGEHFIRVRKGAQGEPNLLPIPDRMRPALEVMGRLVSGRMSGLGEAFAAVLNATAVGWRVELTPRAAPARAYRLRLSGCGTRLVSVDIAEPGGVERRYLLDSHE